MRNLRHSPYYAVADYNLWKGDWELIDGLPYAMSPSPIKEHQYLSAILISEIRNELKKKHGECGKCIFVADLDWIVDDHTVLKPDIAVICDEPSKFISKAPALIIEILSPSTALKDRNVKFEIYEEQQVPYYILVDPITKDYQIFVLEAGRYVQQNELAHFKINNCTIHLSITDALKEMDV